MTLSVCAFAQTPNTARKKPKKTTPPKVEVPPPPAPEPVKEPTLEETKTWILDKMLKYKPIVYITSNQSKKNDCEFQVTAAAFDENDHLILHVKSDAASACVKDQLQSIKIDFTLIDVKKTNTVESTKRVLLFPQNLAKPFILNYAPKSPMSTSGLNIFNVIVAFDKGAAYDPNLATRLGKAFVKMNEFKNEPSKEKEAY